MWLRIRYTCVCCDLWLNYVLTKPLSTTVVSGLGKEKRMKVRECGMTA